jgi:serine/threonine-protein kinase
MDRIGHYTVVEELGRGGMGVVLKAHEASLNRYVAIKVLGEHLATDATYVARFVREAQSAAALNHPNIIQIYFIGEDAGKHYFVMEFVDGVSVARLIRTDGPLDCDRAGNIIRQAAAGLSAAHELGVIHRDIKPANLMVTRVEHVKIADFGLAFLMDANTKLTASGMFLGTPGYLSPEQCSGDDLDARTDIYSLGMTFYEMVTKTMPFKTQSVLALIRQIMDVEPSDPRELNPDVDPATAEIITRMIAKDREARYPSCDELLADLEDRYGPQRSLTPTRTPEPPTVVSAGQPEAPQSARATDEAPTVASGADGLPAAPTSSSSQPSAPPPIPDEASDAPATEQLEGPPPPTPPPPPVTAGQPPPPSAPSPPAPPAGTAPAPPQQQPSTDSPGSPPPRRETTRHRRPYWLIPAVAVIALLLGVGGFLLLQQWTATDTGDTAGMVADTGKGEVATEPSEDHTRSDEGEAAASEPSGEAAAPPEPVQPTTSEADTEDEPAPHESPQAGDDTSRDEPAVATDADQPAQGSGGRDAAQPAQPRPEQQPAPSQPTSATQPLPQTPRVAVLAVGEPVLAVAIGQNLENHLDRVGLPQFDTAGDARLAELVAERDTLPPGTLADHLEDRGVDLLVLARAGKTGERQLQFMGRSEVELTSRVTISVLAIRDRNQLGRTWAEEVQYTARQVDRVVRARLMPIRQRLLRLQQAWDQYRSEHGP